MKLCPLLSDVFRGYLIECISKQPTCHLGPELDYELYARSWMIGSWKANGDFAVKGNEVGDSIHGHMIIAEAIKGSDPVVVIKSGRQETQRIDLTENSLAVINRRGKWCGPE